MPWVYMGDVGSMSKSMSMMMVDGKIAHAGVYPNAPHSSKSSKTTKSSKSAKAGEDAPTQKYPSVFNGGCDEAPNLDQFPQWREEVGYWIGDLSLYGADGTPNESTAWNYRYDNYKGFITGNILGGAYRQRNVFLYPPQTEEKCLITNSSVVGSGACGTNGNTKVFAADQSNIGKSCDGTIEGPFGPFYTNTTLVGADNAVLYQVFLGDGLFQSQMTTLSGNGRRTRTAHFFAPFTGTGADSVPTAASFYRERQVEKEYFYELLNATLTEYNILDEDVCTRDESGSKLEGIVGGMNACEAHLEETFELE